MSLRRDIAKARRKRQAPVTVISQDGSRRVMRAQEYHYLNIPTEKLTNAQALKSLPYEQYLETPHWRFLRRLKLKIAKYRCQSCGKSKTVLHVHHKTYDRLGEELLSDLRVLCEKCHAKRHGK